MGIKNILLVGLSLIAASAFGANTGVGYEVERCDKNMSAIRFAECVKASKEGRKVKQDVININVNTVKELKKADDKPAEVAAPAAAATPAAAPSASADPLAPPVP
jgi:hypothetical protein